MIDRGDAILVAGGDVLTVDAAGTELRGGGVLVRDGGIAGISDDPARMRAWRADAAEVVDAAGCVVIPGLINTHQHHWYNLFKGLGQGMLLERWITELLVPAGDTLTPEDLRAASALSCLEMVRSGTTACLNHQVTATTEAHVAAVLEPVVASGMRQLFAKEIRARDVDGQLDLADAVHRRWHGAAGGRVGIGFAIESTAHWVALGASSEELLLRGADLARARDTIVTDHVAGGTMSRDSGYLRFVLETGRTDIEHLHNLGVLEPRWLLAHAIHVRDRDLDLMAAAGSSVAHTPTSEASRGGGVTPVRRMLAAGVNVALGTDGPMVDTSVDMVEQMKAVRLFQNQLHLDPLAVTGATALEMATIRAARALGWDDRIGSLEVGKRADLVVVDLDTPWSTVRHRTLGALIGSARGLDARDVMVDGRWLLRNGTFTAVSDDERRGVLAEARARAGEAVSRAGLGRLLDA